MGIAAHCPSHQPGPDEPGVKTRPVRLAKRASAPIPTMALSVATLKEEEDEEMNDDVRDVGEDTNACVVDIAAAMRRNDVRPRDRRESVMMGFHVEYRRFNRHRLACCVPPALPQTHSRPWRPSRRHVRRHSFSQPSVCSISSYQGTAPRGKHIPSKMYSIHDVSLDPI